MKKTYAILKRYVGSNILVGYIGTKNIKIIWLDADFCAMPAEIRNMDRLQNIFSLCGRLGLSSWGT